MTNGNRLIQLKAKLISFLKEQHSESLRLFLFLLFFVFETSLLLGSLEAISLINENFIQEVQSDSIVGVFSGILLIIVAAIIIIALPNGFAQLTRRKNKRTSELSKKITSLYMSKLDSLNLSTQKSTDNGK